MPEKELRQAIFDVIIDCPSSPFVLVLKEVRDELERNLPLNDVVRELRAMCDAQLVTWSNDGGGGDFVVEFDIMPAEVITHRYEEWFRENAEDLNLSWDPFGLWFEITDEGRLLWHRNLPSDYEEPLLWRAVMEKDGALVIYAQDEACLARAIESWMTTKQDRQVNWDNRVTEPLPEYVLDINRVIRDGIRVTVPTVGATDSR